MHSRAQSKEKAGKHRHYLKGSLLGARCHGLMGCTFGPRACGCHAGPGTNRSFGLVLNVSKSNVAIQRGADRQERSEADSRTESEGPPKEGHPFRQVECKRCGGQY
jgi:hypothetical protein